MIASKCTTEDLRKALDLVNARYEGNIEFNELTPKGTGKRRNNFTLRVKISNGPGAGRGETGRRQISACWHAHGHFFECLFVVEPLAEVYSSRSGMITISGGNWKDYNVGSMMRARMASQGCECNTEARKSIKRI